MVKIKFFAVLKKLTGREELQIALDQPVPLKSLIDRVELEIPQIRQILKETRAMIAVNQEMAGEDHLVQDGDEIALLPPFAGGECRNNPKE